MTSLSVKKSSKNANVRKIKVGSKNAEKSRFLNTKVAVSILSIFSMAVFTIAPLSVVATSGSGDIWTNNTTCGDPVNINEYSTGDHIFLHGKNFDAGSYDWSIGAPGNSGDDLVSSPPQITVGADGTFCMDVYTVQSGDSGEFQAKVDKVKGDNFKINETETTPSIDVAVDKSVDDTTPDEGQTIVYTIVVTNTGDDATGVTVTDTLPDGVTFVSTTPVDAYNNKVWNIGDLANGDSFTITITATVDEGTAGETITNTATVSESSDTDVNPDNDSDSASITVNTDEVLPPPPPPPTQTQGFIHVVKWIDADGNLNTTDDQTPGTGWDFNINGTTNTTTLTGNVASIGKDVDTGAVTISETQKDGFELVTASCAPSPKGSAGTVGIWNFDSQSGQITGTLNEQNIIICTFYNSPVETPTKGTIHVIKKIQNGDALVDGGEGWEFDIANTNEITGGDGHTASVSVDAGTYSVSEVSKDGYHVVSASCTGATVNGTFDTNITGIEVADGQTVICTFVNAVDESNTTVRGCTDRSANNFDVSANENDGSCIYTLTITTSGNGNGVVDGDDIYCDSNGEENICSFSYTDGTSVPLVVTVDEGSNFNGTWSTTSGSPVTNTCTGNNTNCAVTVNGNITLNAHFGKNSSGGGGGGHSSGGSVLGATTTPTPTPAPVPQVLGASTELPRTGVPAWFLAVLAVAVLGTSVSIGRKFKLV